MPCWHVYLLLSLARVAIFHPRYTFMRSWGNVRHVARPYCRTDWIVRRSEKLDGVSWCSKKSNRAGWGHITSLSLLGKCVKIWIIKGGKSHVRRHEQETIYDCTIGGACVEWRMGTRNSMTVPRTELVLRWMGNLSSVYPHAQQHQRV